MVEYMSAHVPEELSDEVRRQAYAYVLGQYLGDGYIAMHRRGVGRLRIVCSDDWPLVRDRVARSMEILLPRNVVGYVPKQGCVEVAMYSKRWFALIPQHGPGRKHLRSIQLQPWQRPIVLRDHVREFVCGLLHSDGCRSINRVVTRGRPYEYPRYFFSNRSEDIHGLFRQALTEGGMHTTRSGWHQSVARRADVELLDRWGADKSSPWPAGEECPGRDSNPQGPKTNGF